MFYSQFILAKKGPLGTIWIAAHLERKLRKNQVADTDIGVSVDSILFPEVPIALRLSSHLLLGVVRIYSRKVNYLFDDCSEALLKIKQAFRSTAVDLPPEESTAPYHSITLPETFDLDDFELPDNEIFQGNYVDHHVSTREQITLQDTMEGMVYSTSQFGLDERFGDGDTSQIGLDLDEDLFLDKVAVAGHDGVSNSDPQVSAELTIPLEKDVSYERMIGTSESMQVDGTGNQSEGLAANYEFIEYAQAPSTPGLVEVPNLSSVQEALACDDHLESEDHNLTKLVAVQSGENATTKSDPQHGDKNAVDWSLHNDLSRDTIVCMPPEENGCHFGDLEIRQAKPQGGSPSVTTDYTSVDGTIGAPSGSDRVEDIHNGVVSNNDQSMPSIDHTDGKFAESLGVRFSENVSSPSCSHVTSDLENPSRKTCSSSTCHLDDDRASPIPELHNTEIGNDVEESCSLGIAVESNSVSPSELPGRPKVVDAQASHEPKDPGITNNHVHEEVPSSSMHVLQPCSSPLSQPDKSSGGGDNSVVPSGIQSEEDGPCSLETSRREDTLHASGASIEVQGEGCHLNDVMQSEENQISEPTSGGENPANSRKLNEQLDNEISNDKHLENLNGSVISDLPAPEKLLSVPEGLPDKPNDLLVESTPDKEVPTGGDEHGDRIKLISGKKRSFTESTLTMQSLNSFESFGATRSKRTTESIPDDDDLLSSILVGRRSSVLKMKPTPPVPEVTSVKRARSAPRGSALKRKVVMDDMMVLHGDTIRLQLTNTEDIRRIRKKAPCSRPEILMIQRQFLEDEIFNESIFTGISEELIRLHSEAYDLSGTRVYENEENNASSEALRDGNSSVRHNITEESGMEGSTEPVILRNDIEAQPAETPNQTVMRQGEEHHLGSHDADAQGHMTPITDVAEFNTLQHEQLGEISEMEIDRESVEIADAANHGFETSPATVAGFGDICNILAGSVVESAFVDETNGVDVTLPMDASFMSPDKKMDTQPVKEDASLVNISNGKEVDSIEVIDHNDDNIVLVTESKDRDEFLLEESKVGESVEIGADSQTDSFACTDNTNTSLAIMSPEAGRCNNMAFVNGDQAAEEIRSDKLGVVNEGGVLSADLGSDDKNPISNHIFSEVPKLDSTCSLEQDMDMINASLDDGGNPIFHEGDIQRNFDADISALDHPDVEDRDGHENFAAGNDTEFLNVDDDEIAEDDDDGMPCAEEPRLLENSGWSSRTRAVSKYLQTLFDKETVHGRKVVLMDNLLAGKTRKEASRMFFETLVLKTKDYIHVEQAKPFDNINIKPRAKLLKSDF